MANKYYDYEKYYELLAHLIKCGELNETGSGIIKLTLDKGVEKLSPKQKDILDRIIDTYAEKECQRCRCPIPPEELVLASDNGGYCSCCQHMMEKIEKE